MRIIHLYKDYFPPVFGGIEVTVSRLARGAVRAGHDVTVLCSAHGARRDSEETIDGVRVIRCAEWARVASTPLCPGMPARLASLDADLLHLQFPNPPGEISYLLSHTRTPAVMSYQADITAQKALLPFYRPVLEAVLDRMRVLMASSPQYIEHSEFLRSRREKCRVVPLGIDLEPFEQLERDVEGGEQFRRQLGGGPLILFVGRFRYYKGLRVLLRAMVNVPARLILVGGGGEERALRALHRELGLGDRVRFAGSLDQAGLLAHLHAADVFALPSIFAAEAFGLAMIEAMAAGLPVVCTELGTGTSFVNLHEETGLVIPAGDVQALEAAFRRLIADPALRRRMGDAGRRRARAMFSTDSMVEHVLRIYGEVVSAPGR